MTVQVSFRIDNNLKNTADAIFEELGITMADAFRMFLKKVVSDNGIPFEVKLSKAKYSIIKNATEDDIIKADFMDDIWDD